MALKTKLELQCDLCRWPAKSYDNLLDAEREGWIKIGQECYYVDRLFFDSFICPSCIKKIDFQLRKKKV